MQPPRPSTPRWPDPAVAARSSRPLGVVAALWLLAIAACGPRLADGMHHVIVDAEADIRELDVGDLKDMESDVPPTFLEDLRRQKAKPPSLSDMKDPVEWTAAAQSGMQMTFATLKQSISEELGKAGTERLASRWKSMLETGGVNAQCYAVDPGKVLFVTNGAGLVTRVKEFVVSQPETDWFEYQQSRFFPEGRNAPLMDNDERKKREVELGWRKPDVEEKKPSPAEKKKDGKKKKGKP